MVRERKGEMQNKALAVMCAMVLLGSRIWADEPEVTLDKIVVTPDRKEITEESSYADTEVITKGQIAASGASNLKDVLASQIGIQTYSQSSEKNSIVDLKGYGDTAISNVLVLINGRKINSPDLSGYDLSLIPLDSIDHIEVMKAAGTTLYGDHAGGGVINIITKPISDKNTITVSGGSHGVTTDNLELSRKTPWVDFYTSNEFHYNGGYRDNSDIIGYSNFTKLEKVLNDFFTFDIEGGYHRDSYGLPGGLSASELATYGWRGVAPDEENNFANSRDLFIRPTVTQILPNNFGKLTYDYSHRDRETYGYFDYRYFGPAYGETTTARNLKSDNILVKYDLDTELIGRSINLTNGVEYHSDRNHILGGGSGFMISTDDISINKDEFGLFINIDYNLIGHLFTDFGARYTDVLYEFDNHYANSFSNEHYHKTSLSGGLRYEYKPDSRVFFNVSETYRLPDTDEWYNTYSGLNSNLVPQTGLSFQLGISHKQGFDRLSVVPFFEHNHNEIFFDPSIGFFGANSNYDSTKRFGLDVRNEMNFKELLHVPVRFEMNYTYLDAEFNGGSFDGRSIPFVTQNKFGINLFWDITDKFSTHIGGTYRGSMFDINDCNNDMPKVKATTLCNIGGSYKLMKDAILSLEIRNLFDTHYFEYVVKGAGTSTNVDYYPAEGRAVLATFKVSF